jgi:hypothetical protein
MLNKLVSYNFEIAGRLVLDQNNNIAYDIPVSKFISQDHAQVYAWVSGQDILYIGQAGKGLQKRHREHRAGWQNGSATGIKLAGHIRTELQAGRDIVIYGRTCDQFWQETPLLGRMAAVHIDLADHEEDILIQEFSPRWNTNRSTNLKRRWISE